MRGLAKGVAAQQASMTDIEEEEEEDDDDDDSDD